MARPDPGYPKRLSTLQRVLDWLRRRRGEPETPPDPYAYQMAPLRRGPKGRSGAAVAELDE
jgi:hypothetical protein